MNPLILVSVVVSILALVMYLGCYKVNGIARLVNRSINGGERIYHIFIDRACENFDSEEKQIEFLLLRCHMIEEYVKYLELLKERLDCLRMQNLCRSLYLEILKNLHADITDEKREKVYTLVTEESIKKYINAKLRTNKNYKVCFMSHELIRFAVEYIVANKELEIKTALENYKTEERTRLEQAMIKQAILINQKEGYRQEKSLLYSVIKFERNMLFFGKKDQKNLRNEIEKYDRAEIYFLHSTPPPFTHEILKNIDKQQFDPAKALIRMLEDLMQSKSKFDSPNIKWYGPLGFEYSQKENDGGIDVVMSHVTAKFGPDAAQIICSKFDAFKHLLSNLEPLVKRHICLYFLDNPAMKEAINLAIFNLIDELKKFMLSSEDRQQLKHAMTSYKALKIKSKNFINRITGLDLQPNLKEKEKPHETLHIDHDSDDLFYLEDHCSINIVRNAANIF